MRNKNTIFYRPVYYAIKGIKYVIYKLQFRSIHYTSVVADSKMLTPKYIKIGKHCSINNNCRIEGVDNYNNQSFLPLIVLEDGVSIQESSHITCANSIIIGANTSISAFVTITDINHKYDDINIPIEKQNISVGEVSIGESCKIYNGVVILPNVHIGKHSVIGANAVVTHDIPDYCVAVGAPARVVKKYNFNTQQWEKTE